MEITIEFPVVRQIQSTTFYCGAACVSMLINSLGRKVTQDAAYERIRSANAEPDSFYTDPQGFAACIDGVLTRAGNATNFDDETASDGSALLQDMLRVLSDAKVPIPLLVKEGAHWVLCDGALLDRDDQADDVIKTIMIVDPWPTATDRSVIPADVFLQDYLKPIRFGSKWKNRLAYITKQQTAIRRSMRVIKQPEVGGGGEIDDRSIAQRLATLGLRNVAPILAGGVDFEPKAVTDLSGGPDYVIRPLDATANAIFTDFILVAHDALTGRILEVTRLGLHLNYFTDAEAMAIIREKLGAGATLDPGWFFFSSRRLRGRFLVARRIRDAGETKWLMPDGEVSVDQDVAVRGG